MGFFGDMVFSNADWDYKTFDWDRDMNITDDKFGGSLNAVNPELKAFKDHGWSDAAIAPTLPIRPWPVRRSGSRQSAIL